MTARKGLVTLLAALVLLTACNTVVHGKVTGKTVHPAGVIFIPIMTSCGKDCLTFFMVPMFYPESYSVTVSGPDKKGKAAEDELYVDAETWSKTNVGDPYDCGGNKQQECVTARPGGKQQ